MLEFYDSLGNNITIGDKIKIISEYNFNVHTGKEVIVSWSKSYGRYEFKFISSKGNKRTASFYSIKEFELVERSKEFINKFNN